MSLFWTFFVYNVTFETTYYSGSWWWLGKSSTYGSKYFTLWITLFRADAETSWGLSWNMWQIYERTVSRKTKELEGGFSAAASDLKLNKQSVAVIKRRKRDYRSNQTKKTLHQMGDCWNSDHIVKISKFNRFSFKFTRNWTAS